MELCEVQVQSGGKKPQLYVNYSGKKWTKDFILELMYFVKHEVCLRFRILQ